MSTKIRLSDDYYFELNSMDSEYGVVRNNDGGYISSKFTIIDAKEFVIDKVIKEELKGKETTYFEYKQIVRETRAEIEGYGMKKRQEENE